MLEINSPKIDKNLLMEELNNIINRLEKKPKKRLKKKRVLKVDKPIYTIEDFTKYHDREFLENIYKKVLLRDIDQDGLEARLKLLRSGKRSKTEILSSIRFSKEGRDKNIPILGIKKRFILTILNRIPIISFFIKLFMLPRFIERVNRFEANYFLNLKEQNSKVEDIKNSIKVLDSKIENIQNNIEVLDNKIENIQNNLNTHIKIFKDSLNHIEDTQYNFNKKIDNLKSNIIEIRRAKMQFIEIKNSLSNLVKNIEAKSSNFNILKEIEREENHYLDDLYISFEDKFRGLRGDIKKRQSYYIPIVKSVIKEQEKEIIIDIGCGRGEWLELLKESGFRAKGVDLNRLMVRESKALNLDIVEQDGIEFLKSLDSNSISVITGFHIVEHLPFKRLIELFDESYRVLRDGGLIIFETPNPENLFVGSCTFYTDPTHINPIPPVTLEFLAQNRGFKNIEIHRLHPIKKPQFLDIENSQDINNLIFASIKAQDYSIVGYR